MSTVTLKAEVLLGGCAEPVSTCSYKLTFGSAKPSCRYVCRYTLQILCCSSFLVYCDERRFAEFVFRTGEQNTSQLKQLPTTIPPQQQMKPISLTSK